MSARHKRCSRSGVVLLVVLVVVAMLALGAYSFVQLMNIEARGAQSYGRLVQAREAADSGVHYAAAILLDQKFSGALGTDAYDASTMFHGQVVTDESAGTPRLRCRFSLVAPREGSYGPDYWRHGLIDESSKINLNALPAMLQAVQGSQSGADTGGGGGAGTGGGTGASTSSAAGTGTATSNPVLYLPNMTPEIADAILDWIDSDDTPREYGVESEYYQSLSPPYLPRNGPLHSLDELLLIAGVTPRLLYGEDANHNGILDPNEDDSSLSYPYDDGNGTLDRGWLPYITLYTHEPNTDIWDTPRINLNGQDLQALFDTLAADPDFDEEKATFIVAYRLFGPATSGQNQSGQNQSNQNQSNQNSSNQGQSGRDSGSNQNQNSGQSQGQGGQSGQSSSGSTQTIAGLDASGGPKQNIQSVVDLIGAAVNAKLPLQSGQNTAATKELKSPFVEAELDSYLDMLLDRTTTVETKDLPGRINVNTAQFPVLMALPGMTEELGDAIVAARGTSDSDPDALSNLGVSWMISSGAVTKDQFKTVQPYITGRSLVFRVQVTGYYEEGGPVGRVEAVIDMSGTSPRVKHWRDLSRLGRGFDPQTLMGTVSY
jgi:DNA uptake protein ComE-like DNA-binding protein